MSANLPNETYSQQGSITLNEYQPNYLKYSSNTSGNSLAIFSEIYYPEGWVAKIDGNVVPIIRANYVLRALEIPAGEHEIEFSFEPTSYIAGNRIGLIFNIILLLLLAGGLFYTFKNLKKETGTV